MAMEITTKRKFNELIGKIVWLIKNGKKANKELMMNLIDMKKEGTDITTHLVAPNNFTDLGVYVEISSSWQRDQFEMRHSRNKMQLGSTHSVMQSSTLPLC